MPGDTLESPAAATAGERTVPERASTLVLGLGNILLGDEGIGVRVIQAMAEAPLPPDVELFDGATAGLDLLDTLADRRRVIVIDAIDADAPPGTVLRLSPDDLASPCGGGASLHELGLLEALNAARHLGIAPDEVVIIGVKPKDVTWGLALSPGLSRLVPGLIDLVLIELKRSMPAGGRRHEQDGDDQT